MNKGSTDPSVNMICIHSDITLVSVTSDITAGQMFAVKMSLNAVFTKSLV